MFTILQSRSFACAWSISLYLCLLLLGLNAAAASVTNRPTLYYIPHTHWEGAVFKTREEYLQMGLPNILKAVQLLKKYPQYKFALDQVAYFRPFLERYPEEAAAFRRFIAEGRLEIVGGMDVMPDDVKPGGELFVRQMQYGKNYCREELGLDVKVAWMLDTFGHHPQLPQLLKLAGFESFWFCRGVPHRNLASEFLWRGIDGTEIPAVWLPGFYGLFYGPPRELPQFSKFFKQRFDSLQPHSRGPERVGLAGVDVSEPEDWVPPLVEAFNATPDAPFTIRYSVPSEFFAPIAKRRNLPVMTNDLNPIFQGTYSSRIELKQMTRAIEERLLTAEKLRALANYLLKSDPEHQAAAESRELWRAWEPVLFNQTHDLASGVMTDHVYEDTVQSYQFSRRLAEQIMDRAWEKIASHVNTSGEGRPVIVFNSLGWPRTDIVEVEMGFAENGVVEAEVLDCDQRITPSQNLETERYSDGALKRIRLSFLAKDVPAMGYSVYRVRGVKVRSAPPPPPGRDQQDSIETGFYVAKFNTGTGELVSLKDKSLGWDVLSGSGNVIVRQQDKGDLWELYRGLDGGSHVAMKNQQAVPKPGSALFSSDDPGTNGHFMNGPVFSEFSVSHPLGNGSFATRVRLYAGIRRIDFYSELVNNEKYVRYQALFPTSVRDGRQVQEIPFGALERPLGIEFPAQHWIDYSDGRHGVALLNVGMPGNLVSDGTLMLSLLRSHNLGAYGFGGGYEPGMGSETGFELGQQRSFHYALVPHDGDWRQAAIYRAGLEFNHPLLARKVEPHAGALPSHWGLLEISASNVVLTALKPGQENTTVLRLYEAAGAAASGVRIKVNTRVLGAQEANLMEDHGRKLRIQHGIIELDFHPFEIKTILLKIKS